MTGGENAHGRFGELLVERLLRYAGWTIIEHHAVVHGHRLDLLAKHPDRGEALFEVKVWEDITKVGTDNVKKAIADAYDLRAVGETRPYVLVLSHGLPGLYREMLHRAIAEKAIEAVWVVALIEMP